MSIVSLSDFRFIWCSKVFPVTGWLLAHLVKCRASSTWCYNLYWLSRNIAKMIKKRHTWHCTPNKTTTTAEHTPGVIFISLVVVLFRSTKFLPRTHHFLRREKSGNCTSPTEFLSFFSVPICMFDQAPALFHIWRNGPRPESRCKRLAAKCHFFCTWEFRALSAGSPLSSII